eukprot:5707256-Amphidinium_carterae.1
MADVLKQLNINVDGNGVPALTEMLASQNGQGFLQALAVLKVDSLKTVSDAELAKGPEDSHGVCARER